MDNPLKRFHIRTGVLDALGRYGLAHDNRMRAELEANATIAADNNSRVIMKSGNSLDVEIQNRLDSPHRNESFPTVSCTVSKSDTDSLRKNFADIAAGKVRVTE